MKMKYFNYAKNMAEMSICQHKLGCVIVYNNKIIGTGFNSNKTHPIQKLYNNRRFPEDEHPHTIHAELHALSPYLHKDIIDWSKVTLYTYRIRRMNNKYGVSRPCESCMALIKKLGIKRICYTTDDGFVKEYIK